MELSAKTAGKGTKSGPYGAAKYRTKAYDAYCRGQQSSLFDISSNVNYPSYQVFLANLGNQRRRSVPQDIFIRSLNNYTA